MFFRGLPLCAVVVLICGSVLTGWAQEGNKKKEAKKKATEKAVETATAESPSDSSAATKSDSPEASQPKSHEVKPEHLKIEVNLTGMFEAKQTREIKLSPEAWTAFVVTKALPHGARVREGDQLVRFDTSKIDQQIQDLEQAIKLSRLTRRLAEKELELLQTTEQLDREAVTRAKQVADDNLHYFQNTDRDFQEESIRFSLKASQNSLEYAEEELEQLEKMYNADDLTEETEEIVLKRARNDVERARFYLKSSQLRAERSLGRDLPLEEKQLIESAQRAGISLAKALASLPVLIEKQKLTLAEKLIEDRRTEEKLQQLKQDRKMMEVRAPMSGIVYHGKWTQGKWSGADSVASQLTAGGKISPLGVFMTIVNPRPLQIHVAVPEKDLYRLSRSIKGTAVPTGYPHTKLETTLGKLSPLPTSSGVFDAQFEVVLDDKDRQIVPGMGCKVTLVAYDKKDALTVPADAVFEDEDGQTIVYIKSSDEKPAEKRKVVIGQKTESKWEVVRGLKVGDTILTKEPETP